MRRIFIFISSLLFIFTSVEKVSSIDITKIKNSKGINEKCQFYNLEPLLSDLFPSGIIVCYDVNLDENFSIIHPQEIFSGRIFILDEIHGEYLKESLFHNSIGSILYPKPCDVYAFWYTPSGKIVNLNGLTFNSIEEVKPVLTNWTYKDYFSAYIFFPIPVYTQGIYFFFQGIKNSEEPHKFTLKGWTYIFLHWAKGIKPNFSCNRFKTTVKSLKSLEDLANFVSYINHPLWNIFSYLNLNDVDIFRTAAKCYTMCDCNNDNWRLTCTQVANFIIKVLKTKQKEWEIKKAWIVGLHGNDTETESSLGCGHALTIFATKEDAFGLIDAYHYIKGTSATDVLKRYIDIISHQKGWECFKDLKTISFRKSFTFSHGLDALPFESNHYLPLIERKGVITSLEYFRTPGWFIASWKWIQETKLTLSKINELLGEK